MATNKYKQTEDKGKTRASVSTTKAVKPHRERKNPRSAELHREAKRAKNAERFKQVYVPGVGWDRPVVFGGEKAA
jgi:hypothetical protein